MKIVTLTEETAMKVLYHFEAMIVSLQKHRLLDQKMINDEKELIKQAWNELKPILETA